MKRRVHEGLAKIAIFERKSFEGASLEIGIESQIQSFESFRFWPVTVGL